MQIHVALCDLVDLPVDAIVNPGNSMGLMSSGVSADILMRGGRAVEDEAKASAPVAVGAAIVTTGGTLFAKSVIHTPIVEEPGMKPSIEGVRKATRASLVAAAQMGFDTIGLPPMCGPNSNLPSDETARAMVDELRAHKPTVPATVYLVSRRSDMIAAYEEALRNASIPG